MPDTIVVVLRSTSAVTFPFARLCGFREPFAPSAVTMILETVSRTDHPFGDRL